MQSTGWILLESLKSNLRFEQHNDSDFIDSVKEALHQIGVFDDTINDEDAIVAKIMEATFVLEDLSRSKILQAVIIVQGKLLPTINELE